MTGRNREKGMEPLRIDVLDRSGRCGEGNG